MAHNQVVIVTETLPPAYGGADIAGYRYFRYLNRGGERHYLLGMHNNKLVAVPGVVPIKGVNFPKWFSRWGGNYVRFAWLWIQVMYFLLSHPHVKIVHCFNGSSWLIQAASLAAVFGRRKLVIETCLVGSDDPVTVLKPRGWFSRVIRAKWLRKATYLAADAYVAKSTYLRDKFIETSIGTDQVYIIPYAVDTNRFSVPTTEEKHALRKALGLPENSRIICFAGGINHRKGVHLLVKAFQMLLSSRQDVYLALVGPYEKYDMAFVKQITDAVAAMPDKARLTGMVQEPERWMRASDVFVLPTYREGFPISVLEALCCGLCVVAADIPEIKNVQIKDEINGFLFQTGSVDDLYAGLMKAMTQLENRKLNMNQIQREASELYDQVSISRAYSSLYEKLMETKNGKD